MEEEKDEAVVRELILALGRIGSPDAVQALIKWRSRLVDFSGGSRATARGAVEALRLAASPAALAPSKACRTTVTAPSARRPAGP